jgi:hypothetical protein
LNISHQFDGPDLSENVEQRPSGLPSRNRCLPQRYCDIPPPLPIPVPVPAIIDPGDEPLGNDLPAIPSDIEMNTVEEMSTSQELPIDTSHCRQTEPDGNDLFREYSARFPSHDPENVTSLEHLCDGPTFQRVEDDKDAQLLLSRGPASSTLKNYFSPFLNATIWRLMSWVYNSATQKSLDDLNHLVHDVILADDFNSNDLHQFNARHETKWLDDTPSDTSFSTSDGWHTTSISIRLPCDKVKQTEDTAPEFHIEGLHYRKITKVVKSAFEEPAARMFHHAPYKVFWQPDKTWPPECVVTELYTSDAMLEEYQKVDSKPPEVPGCNLETVITVIMLWSDSTHLASFGNAALWPVYLFLGNQSKYSCAKPKSFAAHHLAYIPKVVFISRSCCKPA